MPNEQQLKVTVQRIMYPNEATDKSKRDDGEKRLFYILECQADTGINVKCKGELYARPTLGERMIMTGDYVVWQGQRQFAWKTAEINLPVNERDMLRYACEMTKGLGPALEAAIWERLGENWREIDESCDVRGMTAGKLNALRDTISMITLRKQETQTIAWLMSLGCSKNMAYLAWEKWAAQTQTRISADVYVLCELPNYGFSDADKLRGRFGIGDTDERRLRAAVLYCMNLLTEGGENCIPWFALDAELKNKLPDVSEKVYAQQVRNMFDDELIAWQGCDMIAFRRDYEDELAIYNYVMGYKDESK